MPCAGQCDLVSQLKVSQVDPGSPQSVHKSTEDPPGRQAGRQAGGVIECFKFYFHCVGSC